MDLQTIAPKEYLIRKNIQFREVGKELIFHCVFNDCDKDSKGTEAHLYMDSVTGQYDCKKCGAKGNLITLAKHFKDNIQDIAINPVEKRNETKQTKITDKMVEIYHFSLPENIRAYLNNRGISNEIINKYKLGWGKFYNKWWITIPIKNTNNNYQYYKLREDPNTGSNKSTFPKSTDENPVEAQIYDWEILKTNSEKLIICEGELDMLALLSVGISAITSTHGAMTFKQSWVDSIGQNRKIYICFDKDDAGIVGAKRVANLLQNTENEIYITNLPDEVGDHGDITDYLTKVKGDVTDLFDKYAKRYPEPVDISNFKPLTTKELVETLGLTIKQDEENKVVTFLCELSAYTENAQFNISYNAPSSTGKSYIPLEISNLFPSDDVLKLGNCSPTAFFHEQGEYDKDSNTITVDLSRKIIIFLDQPHTSLLERLRSLLSHDEKEMHSKITDKNQHGGNRTKTVIIKGFPSVIFCTAGLTINEQEATRFLLLSPNINNEKIRQGIIESIKKEADPESYFEWLDQNPERILLKKRIQAIKNEKIKEIKIANYEKIASRFLDNNPKLKPRHQRDSKRLISLVKSFALLNLWWRDKNGSTITANDSDIEDAFNLWNSISVSQDLNLPPYIYNLYQEVIMEAWHDKNSKGNQVTTTGLSRQDIQQKHFEVYGRMIDVNQLRQQILPMLETSGLIFQEADSNDKRKILIYPAIPNVRFTKLDNNKETYSGVNNFLGK